jgi:sarcosine/dimethylglycine N-methyltransferase
VKSGTAQVDRERIYQRVKTPVMWDMDDYRRSLMVHRFEVLQTQDWSAYVFQSYSWIRTQVDRNRDRLLEKLDSQTIDSTLESLDFWVDSANAGKIGWALFVAVKSGA